MKVKNTNHTHGNSDSEIMALRLATYEQAMANIRSLMTVGTQILSALAVADVTVLGFAFSFRKASTLPSVLT